ncbi:MAG: 50S ribosomal protein L27 [Patescibacteria group bacterium]|jgi:large subunit ribosomal protein L27
MAHVKGAGTTSLGRDSQGQRLGIKLYGGQLAKKGSIIVRQKGTVYHAGKNVKRSANDTLFSLINGIVSFKKKKIKLFNGRLKETTFVSILPSK